jgi:hypothetical protein
LPFYQPLGADAAVNRLFANKSDGFCDSFAAQQIRDSVRISVRVGKYAAGNKKAPRPDGCGAFQFTSECFIRRP